MPAALDDGIADAEPCHTRVSVFRIDWQCEAQDRTHTLLTKLHELRKTPQKSPHTMTDTIQKKARVGLHHAFVLAGQLVCNCRMRALIRDSE